MATLENAYIEKILNDIQDMKEVSDGARDLACAYTYSNKSGFDILVMAYTLWPKNAESFAEELHRSGIRELYFTHEGSNMFQTYMTLSEHGLNLRGVVRIENAAFRLDMVRYGESDEKPYILALKFSFDD